LDELAAIVSNPAGGRSFVEADRARWDYHPIMASRWVNARKAGQGKFYEQPTSHDFPGMVKMMKEFVVSRGQWCDSNLLSTSAVPATPKVEVEGPLDVSKGSLRVRATAAQGHPTDYEWRLAEVSKGPVRKPLVPRKYEIEALWEQRGKEAAEIPTTTLQPGRTYRIRARARDAEGHCGHWSEPIEFGTGK
jgi:hypothetical protein